MSLINVVSFNFVCAVRPLSLCRSLWWLWDLCQFNAYYPSLHLLNYSMKFILSTHACVRVCVFMFDIAEILVIIYLFILFVRCFWALETITRYEQRLSQNTTKIDYIFVRMMYTLQYSVRRSNTALQNCFHLTNSHASALKAFTVA